MWVEPAFDKSASLTSKRLGEEYRISHSTIERYSVFAHALDTLSEVVPEFVPKILSGQIKIARKSIVKLSQLSPQEICRLSEQISDEAVEFARYSGVRKVLPKKKKPPRKLTPPIPTASVKDMPAYDPDSEISGLVLTIPSWVSSIDRTRSIANLSGISGNARSKLERELLGLKETIDTMLAAIKEAI